jgi:hypothetical protein
LDEIKSILNNESVLGFDLNTRIVIDNSNASAHDDKTVLIEDVVVLVQPSEGSDYTGPLDIVPGAVVAYDQRALSAAKRGTALYTIREDTGDTTQSFNSDATTGAAPIAAITAFLNGANGFLSVWNDQSSNGANIDSSGTPPLWSTSGPSGLPVFGNVDASGMATTNEITFPNGAATVFLVCKQNGGNDSIGTEMNFNTSSFVRLQAPEAGGAIAVQDIYNADTGNEARARYDIVPSADYQLWVGAWSLGSHTPTSVFDTTDPPGSITDRLITNFGDAGEFVAALYMYDIELSDPDILAISQNIASYYGITLP